MLAYSAAQGVHWTSLAMLVNLVIQVVRLVVLGRLLSPDAFGLLAMMLVVIGFATLVSQAGLNEALIQHSLSPTPLELSSLYWANVLFGLALYVLLSLFAPLIALIYSTPELNKLLPWMALSFLVFPWASQFRALLQKDLQFKPIAIIDIFSVFMDAVVAILLAWKGYGVWALVWGYLGQSLVTTLLFFGVACKRHMLPNLVFSFSALKPYLSFGLRLLGSNVLNYFNSRVDQLIVGGLLGAQALGYYSMAFNLVLLPAMKINMVLTQVAFPVLAKVRDDREKLRRGYFEILELLTSINAPMLIGIAVVAPLLIPIVLGEEWQPLVELVQILALFSLIRSTGNIGGSLVLAAGRADVALYWNLALFMIIPIAVALGGIFWKLQGVAWILVGLQLFLVFAWYYFVVKKLVGDCFFGFVVSIFRPISLSFLMAFVVIMTSPLLVGLSLQYKLVCQILFGFLGYLVIYILFRREFVKKYYNLLMGNKY